MKPINTFSSELLRKVSHSNEYKGMNPDQVFLSISQYAQFWIEIPLIYMKGGMIASVKLGVDVKAKYALSFPFFDDKEL
jgi:hypothetical protein